MLCASKYRMDENTHSSGGESPRIESGFESLVGCNRSGMGKWYSLQKFYQKFDVIVVKNKDKSDETVKSMDESRSRECSRRYN